MALQSIKILNIGKENMTKLLVGMDSPYSYKAIGVGNSATAAAETDEHLLGTETNFKDGNTSYYQNDNGSYVAQWNSTWVYNDLPSNQISEAAVAMNATNGTTSCLLRCTFDTVTLDEDSSFALTLRVIPTQG